MPVYAQARGGGPPLLGADRLLYAWCGDATLVPHLWRALTLPGAEVVLRFHPPVAAGRFESRKELADHARTQVARGLAHDLAGCDAAPATGMRPHDGPGARSPRPPAAESPEYGDPLPEGGSRAVSG